MESTIQSGTVFKHYKGNLYEFITFAIHSETREEVVVYKALYGEYGIWVRPKSMFFEMIVIDGGEMPRFRVHND